MLKWHQQNYVAHVPNYLKGIKQELLQGTVGLIKCLRLHVLQLTKALRKHGLALQQLLVDLTTQRADLLRRARCLVLVNVANICDVAVYIVRQDRVPIFDRCLTKGEAVLCKKAHDVLVLVVVQEELPELVQHRPSYLWLVHPRNELHEDWKEAEVRLDVSARPVGHGPRVITCCPWLAM